VVFSLPPGGLSITAYRWRFGDGSEGSGPAPTHTYTSVGTFLVSLEVTDSAGFTSSVAAQPIAINPVGGGGTTTGTSSSGGGGPATPSVPLVTTVAAAPTGTVSVPGAISVKSNGRATARLSCAGTAATCSGEVVLTVKRTETVNGHKRTRTITIGSFRFTIRTSGASNVTFTLKPAGRSLLRTAGGKLKVTETLHRASPAPALTRSQSARLSLVRHR
jgi:PKD repeat protein